MGKTLLSAGELYGWSIVKSENCRLQPRKAKQARSLEARSPQQQPAKADDEHGQAEKHGYPKGVMQNGNQVLPFFAGDVSEADET